MPVLLVAMTLASVSDFRDAQERAPRVVAARARVDARVQKLFEAARIAYPPAQLYLRAFKGEAELEVWGGPAKQPLTRIVTYPICATSGGLGPKRARGDSQVPEGFYRVARFNPYSNFHLSLGIDYPNAADRILGHRGALGGDIFIHGSCVTIGCIPIQDGPIEELYVVALDTRLKGGRIDVHIFPRRLDEKGLAALRAESNGNGALWHFWQSLAPAYRSFEVTHRVPRVRVDGRTGAYLLASPGDN